VLNVEYIPQLNYMASCGNDLSILFWDMSSFNLRQRISTPEIQLCLRYVNWNIHVEKGKEDKKKRLLYSGGSDSIIHIYELVEFKEIGVMPSWNPYFSQPSDKSGH
jgi:WD40 repeat protein